MCFFVSVGSVQVRMELEELRVLFGALGSLLNVILRKF